MVHTSLRCSATNAGTTSRTRPPVAVSSLRMYKTSGLPGSRSLAPFLSCNFTDGPSGVDLLTLFMSFIWMTFRSIVARLLFVGRLECGPLTSMTAGP